MRATWSMRAGLNVVGQHKPGQRRLWTVQAWAQLEDGRRETVQVRPKAPCKISDLISIINKELGKFEEETGMPSVDAGFTALAR
jgi:hypothetical protein